MRATLLRLLGIPLALSLLIVSPAFAETGIRAVVCTGDAQPTLALLPDINDTTLRVNRVEISGLVERVSAVDVYVDSDYDHTVAIPANDTTFATSVRLPIGTHNLHIEAVGICTSNNATKDAVVTIIPWNYGFARPTSDVATEPSGSTPQDNSAKSLGESLDEVIATTSTEERMTGLLGLLQMIFPDTSLKELAITTAFVAAAALPLLPSGVLAQGAMGQFIAGRRTLFLALIPVIGTIFMVFAS